MVFMIINNNVDRTLLSNESFSLSANPNNSNKSLNSDKKYFKTSKKVNVLSLKKETFETLNQIPTPPAFPTKAIAPHYHIQGFLELIKNLPPEEKDFIKTATIDEIKINEFVATLNKSHVVSQLINIKDEISNLDEISLKSILALRDGKITIEQVTTLHMLIAALFELVLEPKSCIVYNSKGKTTIHVHELPNSFENLLLSQIDMKTVNPQNTFIKKGEPMLKKHFALNDHEWDQFLKLMHEVKVESEKTFFSINLPKFGCWSPIFDHTNEIIDCMHPIEHTPVKFLAIPSFSMLQVFLKVKALGRNRTPVELIPTFGSLTMHDVERLKALGQTPLGLYAPEQTAEHKKKKSNRCFMEVIDGWSGGGPYSFLYHDIYHAIREMQMKEGIAFARIRMATLFKHEIEKAIRAHAPPELIERMQKLEERLIDGELILSYMSSEFKMNKALDFGSIFYARTVKKLFTPELRKIILQDMVDNAKEWEENFGILPEHLELDDFDVYQELVKKKESLTHKLKKSKRSAPL